MMRVEEILGQIRIIDFGYGVKNSLGDSALPETLEDGQNVPEAGSEEKEDSELELNIGIRGLVQWPLYGRWATEEFYVSNSVPIYFGGMPLDAILERHEVEATPRGLMECIGGYLGIGNVSGSLFAYILDEFRALLEEREAKEQVTGLLKGICKQAAETCPRKARAFYRDLDYCIDQIL